MSSHKNQSMNNKSDTLLELDEYLRDESNGHKLAQFIQQKMGAARTKESVFAGFPMPDFNVNVKLKRCKEKQTVSTNEIGNQLPLKDVTNDNTNVNKNKASLDHAKPKVMVVVPVEKETVTVPTVEATTSPAAALIVPPQEATQTAEAFVETQGIANASATVPAPTLAPVASEQSPIKSLGTTTEQHYVNLPTPNIPSPQAYETVPQHSPTHQFMESPRSGLRRSGNCADNLRRSAMKRRRRQLFTDYEESPINFAPIVYSTPSIRMLSGASSNANTPHQHNPPDGIQINRENPASNANNITTSTTTSCPSGINSHNLMEDIERRDVELRHVIQGMLNKTLEKVLQNSNSNNNKNESMQPSEVSAANPSRTYTIVKGSTTGEVVLVPVVEPTVDKTLVKEKKPVVYVRNLSTMLNQTTQMSSPAKTKTILTIQSPIRVETSIDRTLVPGTPSPNRKTLINVSTAGGADAGEDVEIIIPETQEVVQKTNEPAEDLNQSGGGGSTSVWIRPVCCQTFYSPKRTRQPLNTTTNNVAANTTITNNMETNATTTNNMETNTHTEEPVVTKATSSSSTTGTQSTRNTTVLGNKNNILTNKSIQTTIVCNNDNNVNNLITDDESADDVDVVDDVLKNNSTAPLNLAPSGSVSTRKRLRAKALTKSSKKQDDCALNLRKHHQQHAEGVSRNNKKKNKIQPLNKAPNEPINGEKFARELARMTYNEIVDLRKRNSMGKVFPICGRRSSALVRNTVIDNQQQLEESIDREILRRNLSSRQSNTSNMRVETTIVSSQEQQPLQEASMLPAPFGFEDTQRHSEAYSMTRPSTRVSRAASRSSRYKKSKSPVMELTETLKNYIDAKSKVQDRTVTKRNSSTKRYLYNKGDSIFEESSSGGKENEIEIVRSPPSRTFNPIEQTGFIIVSPPPPLYQSVNESMSPPPPPPQFGSTNEKSAEKQCDVVLERDDNVNECVVPYSTVHRVSKTQKSNINQQMDREMETSDSDYNCGQNVVPHQMETNHINEEDNVDLELPQSEAQSENEIEMGNIPAALELSNQTQNKSRFKRISTKTQSEDKLEMIADQNRNSLMAKSMNKQETDKSIKRKAGPASRKKTKKQRTKEQEMENSDNDSMVMESLRLSTPTPPNVTESQNIASSSSSNISKKKASGAKSKTKATKTAKTKKKQKKTNKKENATIKEKTTMINSVRDGSSFSEETQQQQAETEMQQPEEDEGGDVVVNENAAVPEAFVEPLAVQVELVAAHSTTTSPTNNNIIDDGEIPSTSRAAAAKRNQTKMPAPSVINDDAVFKKPSQPAPKRATRTKKKQPAVVLEEDNNDTTIRRSKRGQVPRKYNWSFQQGNQSVSLFQYLYDKQMNRCMEQAKKRRENETLKSRIGLSMQNAQPICSSTPLYTTESLEPSNSKASAAKPLCYGPESIANENRRRNMQLSGISELPAPSPALSSNTSKATGPTNKTNATKTSKTKKNQKKTNKTDDTNNEARVTAVEELNNIFDGLRAASFCEEQPQPVETESRQQPEEEDEGAGGVVNEIASVENAASNPVESEQNLPSSRSKESRNELIAWLKGVSVSQIENERTFEMLEGMQISSRGNLQFTDLDGIDYAFYDTDVQFSLGYMRFKPLQTRPIKRARDCTLNFIVLSGEFIVCTNSLESSRIEQRTLGPGDMATINKGARYSLQNKISDISIMMVVKK